MSAADTPAPIATPEEVEAEGAVGGAVAPDTPLSRALDALRQPHPTLARVANTVRQNIADVLVDQANRAFLAEKALSALKDENERVTALNGALQAELSDAADEEAKWADEIEALTETVGKLREALEKITASDQRGWIADLARAVLTPTEPEAKETTNGV